MDIDFDSINPYQGLQAITEDSPDLLVAKLKMIKTPIKIVQICHTGTKATAYIMGDIRPINAIKKKGK